MQKQSQYRYLCTLLIIAAATVLTLLLLPHFMPANLVMIYLLAVVIVSTSFGRGPAILASVLSVCIFDFFCIPPYLTFAVNDSQYLLTFGVMLTTALVITKLTTTAREQAEMAIAKEHQTAILYSFSKALSDAQDLNVLCEIGKKHMTDLVGNPVEITVRDLDETPGHGATAQQSNKSAILLKGATRTIGEVHFPSGLLNCDQEKLATLDAFVSQLATACERDMLSRENEKARSQVKTEQLRSSLLSSISHDLRTPLATITGAASGIMESGSSVKLAECRELAGEIYNESRRLNRLVGNLLDMTRLESGALEIKKEPQPVDEIIGSAISYYEDQLANRQIETDIPADLPMVLADAVLIQQLMINLLENAVKYTPSTSSLKFKAKVEGEFIKIEIDDRGPGIPDEQKSQIFKKFVRATDKARTTGAGLGLAICTSIVEAHNGSLGVTDREGGGSSFWFTLPVDKSAFTQQEQTINTKTATAQEA